MKNRNNERVSIFYLSNTATEYAINAPLKIIPAIVKYDAIINNTNSVGATFKGFVVSNGRESFNPIDSDDFEVHIASTADAEGIKQIIIKHITIFISIIH
jgi:hypothetical protein